MSIATFIVCRVVARVVRPAGRRLVRELLGGDEAAHAQVDRIDLHLERERVDHALHEVHGLGDAERAAVGDAARRLVRVDGLDLDVRRLEVVGAAHDVEEPGRELRRLRRAVERAVVGDHVDPQARDLAVLRAHLAAHDVVAGEPGGHQVLGAVLDPLDRHAGDDRARDRAHVAGIDRHLVAEAAADVRAADPDHVLREPGDVRVDGAVGVRRLVAVVDVELAGLRVEVGDHPARLERRRMAAGIDDVALDDRVRLGERPVGRGLVARLPGRAREVVALPRLVVADQRRVGIQRLARIHDRRQRLVLDVDQLERVVRGVLVGRDHERDLLALEADLVAGEHGLRVVGDRRHPGEAERLEILRGDDGGDVRVCERPRRVDRDDARVRERASQQRSVHHARELDVVEVGALAADEARVLLALQTAEADRALGSGAREVLDVDGHAQTPCLAAASCSAAQRTALTMFLYPVQRQMAPEIATRISCSVGFGFSSRSARAVISIPGVQNPHCSACRSWKPIWTGSSRPSTSSDSTVRISCPSHITARVVHDLTGLPSISTTQAPQLEVSQPQCVPVRPGVSRMKCTSSWRGSMSRETVSPLIDTETSMLRPPGRARARSRAAGRVL